MSEADLCTASMPRQPDAVNPIVAGYFEQKSESTKNAYVSLVKTLWTKGLRRDLKDLEHYDWHAGNWVYDNYDQLEHWALNTECSNATKKTYFNVMVVLLKDTCKDKWSYLDGPYIQAVNMLRKFNAMIEAQEDLQEMDAKELKYVKSHDELLAILDLMREKIRDLPAFIEMRPLTAQEVARGDWTLVFEFLALASMVLQPPVRGEWGNMLFTIKQDENDVCDELNQNYLYCGEGKNYFKINQDKVSGKEAHKDNVIGLTEPFAAAIAMTMVLCPRRFVFPRKSDPKVPMIYMPLFLRKIRHPTTGVPMNQGVQILRSSYITWFYGRSTATLADKKELARQMRHSWEVAERHYRKVIVNND